MAGERTVRVLVTGPDINDAGGAGVQRHVRTLVDCFSRDDHAAIEPFRATSAQYKEPWLLKIGRLAVRYAAFPFAARRADVVHVNASIDDRSLLRDAGFVMLTRLLRRSVLLQFHGGHPDTARVLHIPVLRRLLVRVMRASQHVLFLSEGQGEPMREIFGFGSVEYVKNYVPVPALSDGALKAADGLHVLYFGRLDEPKGVRETIEGFCAARRAGWELRIAGTGSIAEEVAAKASVSEGVTYLGFLDDSARDRELAWADVFVLPSAHPEGLPYAALEAAAAGVALVTSASGALAQITRPGETGLLVAARDSNALAEALMGLAEERTLLERMQTNAAQMVRDEYSLETMRDEFTRIYREVRSR